MISNQINKKKKRRKLDITQKSGGSKNEIFDLKIWNLDRNTNFRSELFEKF